MDPNGKGGPSADGEIDEGLYSRQLYVLGKEAMGRMASARILISGLGGLGVEVAKNVILGGVRSVALHDQKTCSWFDMSSQFYLSNDVKQNIENNVNRAEASLTKLSELNPYVRVNLYNPTHDDENKSVRSLHDIMRTNPDDLKSNFDLIVVSDYFSSENSKEFSEILELSEFCHNSGIKFILCETRGVFSRVFVDFGKEFVINDPNGEQPVTAMISMISQEKDAVVTCLDETRHGLEDGDSVVFSEVSGLEGINSKDVVAKVQVTGPYTFKTDLDTTQFSGEYLKGGQVTQIKVPKRVGYRSLRDFLLVTGVNGSDDCVITDFAKFEHIPKSLLAFNSFNRFSRLPKIENFEKDEIEFIKIAREVHQDNKAKASESTNGDISASSADNRMEVDDENRLSFAKFDDCEFDEEFLKKFFLSLNGNLCPMNNCLGGIVAQEVMKGTTGKFTPIKQFLFFDAIEVLNIWQSIDEKADKVPKKIKVDNLQNRYIGQTCLFGEHFQARLNSAKIFIVGAGAIGCELIKNFAMMGVGASSKGRLIVTDMDLIEKSNLNRQFLFRPENVGKAKSTTAAKVAKEMNPSMNIVSQLNRVGADSEDIYDDTFFEKLDVVTNALDNVDARIYMDRRCVYYRKPLLESGTLGTKGNSQVVIPFVTESYGSSQDPPEKSIPICTLKNFPNAIEHTLQWARDLFEGIFKQQAENAAAYLNDDKFADKAMKLPGSQPMEILEGVRRALVDERPRSFLDCVKFARLLYEDNFVNQIRQLLFNFPSDQTTSSGALFWSGPKKCPKPINFVTTTGMEVDDGGNVALENGGDTSSGLQLLPIQFIYATANLRAEMYGIPQVRDMTKVEDLAKSVQVPVFTPKSGVRIAVTETEAQQQGNGAMMSDNVDDLKKQLDTLRTQGAFNGLKVTPLEFEKDDDSNLHMDFIVAASNSRALNYGIQTADRLKSKLIAGKIIPAIATTTSVVAGLISLELYKILMIDLDRLVLEKALPEQPNLEQFKNGFVNLALPFFGFSEPIRCLRSKYYENEWSLWDRFEITGDLTLKEFIELFKNQHGLEITMISQGICMLYSFFMPPEKRKERLELPIVEVVRQVSKKSLDRHVRALVFELCCNDNEGEDVEVPYVRYVIPERYLK